MVLLGSPQPDMSLLHISYKDGCMKYPTTHSTEQEREQEHYFEDANKILCSALQEYKRYLSLPFIYQSHCNENFAHLIFSTMELQVVTLPKEVEELRWYWTPDEILPTLAQPQFTIDLRCLVMCIIV